MTLKSISYTISPPLSILAYSSPLSFLLKTSRPNNFLPYQNSHSIFLNSKNFPYYLSHKQRTQPMHLYKTMTLHFYKPIVHTITINFKKHTVSHICNCTYLSSNCTVFDLKSTPTVILYSFKNYPCMYL